ncbi:acyltransferase family protein [Stutzerimonas nitrititolerans]|uniref:acyltransferase family protein n=1 Tax=Stutzerimonas nitrititolerans TaxID=2482751 RepID=UPI0007188D83|nr:acyltransferase [Stutzerimonas nitrititolerans]KRW60231.1 acyltransferase [Pseudomonas sp. TTU2014-066ASC]
MRDQAYSSALDGIRALAALAVAIYHARFPGLPGGFFGVDVFFVLSGYLITRLLMNEHSRQTGIRLGRFIIRRVRRLLPALALMLLTYLLTTPWLFPDVAFTKHLRDAFLSAIYVVNYATALGSGVSVLGHAWSLAVEMQFYLLWPLLLLGLMRLPKPIALGLILVLYVLATALRWWSSEHLAIWAFYPRTETHCSGLLLGCLLGYAGVSIHRHWAVVGLVVLFLAMTFFSTAWMPTVRYGFTIAEIGAALLILAQPAWLGGSMLAWLGRMSYGLYLWHYPIMRLVRDRDGWEWPEVLLLGGGLGLLLAVLSHYLLERRFHQPRFSVSRNGLA